MATVTTTGPCKQNSGFLQEGQKYFQREQYLLASIQFKIASQFACANNDKNGALFSYMISMNKLNERAEVLTTLTEIDSSGDAALKSRLALFKNLELKIQSEKELSTEQLKRMNLWENRQFDIPNRKSPGLAGTMSAVLPGSGQAYVGAWSSALYSFALNSLFLATSLEFQREGLHTAALASAAIFSITYVGGIISANQAAHLYNQTQILPLEKQRYLELFPELVP